MTALQNDERANYQVDVKFQESYLKKVVDLLHCQLTEGAAMKSDSNDVEMHNSENPKPNELEEGELSDSHGINSLSFSCKMCSVVTFFFLTFPNEFPIFLHSTISTYFVFFLCPLLYLRVYN